jgi:transcriptional regulator with XRE-family HTH domain
MNEDHVLSKAEVAKRLGISRTYVTLLIQQKRQPSSQLVDQMRQLQLTSVLPPELLSVYAKWGSGDLNPDALRHKILSLARLPIPTLPREIGLRYFIIDTKT